MEIIIVSYGERQEIMKKLNVSYPTIRKALNGKASNDLARKIREMALRRGGKVITILN